MSTLISNQFGRPWEDRTPTAGFEDQNDIHFTKGRIVWSGVTESNRYLGSRNPLYYPLYERQRMCIIRYLLANVNAVGALTKNRTWISTLPK